MKHVSVIVPETAVIEAIADPRYLFTAVNQFLEMSGRPSLFTVQLVGLNNEIRLNNNSFSVHTDARIQDIKRTDLIVIPALSGDIPKAVEANKDFVPWITEQYKNGAEVIGRAHV